MEWPLGRSFAGHLDELYNVESCVFMGFRVVVDPTIVRYDDKYEGKASLGVTVDASARSSAVTFVTRQRSMWPSAARGRADGTAKGLL